jgi:hypothetical protein
MLKSTTFLAVLLPLAGAHVWAADPKWYVGLDLGQTKFDSAGLLENVDDRDTSYTVRIGYRFVPWFALETGYTDLGDFSGDSINFCPAVVGFPCPPAAHQSSSLHGLLLNAVGIWPVAEHFQLNASLGAFYRELSTTYSGGGGPTSHFTSKDTVTRFGLGVAVPINPRFEIALEYAQFRDIGLAVGIGGNTTVVDQGESSMLSLGLRWRF